MPLLNRLVMNDNNDIHPERDTFLTMYNLYECDIVTCNLNDNAEDINISYAFELRCIVLCCVALRCVVSYGNARNTDSRQPYLQNLHELQKQ